MSALSDFFDSMQGIIFPTASLTAPNGFLMCDGSAYSRTTYARLFAAISLSVLGQTNVGSTQIQNVSQDITGSASIGMPISGAGIPAGATVAGITSTTITLSVAAMSTNVSASIVVAPYGIGDGSTTFNVPDIRGRVISGRDNMGGTAAGRMTSAVAGFDGTLLGAAGGAQSVALSTTQLPVHNHPVFLQDPGHTHPMNPAAPNVLGSGTSNGYTGGSFGDWGLAIENNTTGITVRDAAGGGGTANQTATAGTGAAHANVQPTMVLNHIIKT